MQRARTCLARRSTRISKQDDPQISQISQIDLKSVKSAKSADQIFTRIAPSPFRTVIFVIGAPRVPSALSGRYLPGNKCVVAVASAVEPAFPWKYDSGL